MQDQGVPAIPVLNSRDLQEDPHLLARECFHRIPHPEVGTFTLMGAPWKLAAGNGTPDFAPNRAPLLGEHTEAIMQELGFNGAQIEHLRKSEVL